MQYVDNIRRYYETLQWITDEAEIEEQATMQLLAEQPEKPVSEKPEPNQEKQQPEQTQSEN